MCDERLYNFNSFIEKTVRIIKSERENNVKEDTLMIVGLQTNFCIDATVKSAFERGYQVIIPQGTNSTFDNDYMTGEITYKYYNDMMWPEIFAECVSVDEAIGLLERVYQLEI